MIRSLLRFLFSALGILAAARLVPGILAGRFQDLLLVALLLGLLNVTLGAFLKGITVVPRACSFGCLSLVINGLVFWLAGFLARHLGLDFQVRGYWAAFFGALVASVVASVLEWALFGREDRRPDPPRRLKIIN